MTDRSPLLPLSAEFSGAQLGDPRRVRRVMMVADSAVRAAGESLPKQAGGDPSVLEGTYRLLGNDKIEPEQILAAHQERTAERASRFDEVVVCHDTTSFEFKGESAREGLGLMCGQGQGLYAHFSLVLSRSGEPLGVLGLRAWCRGPKPKVKLHPRDRGLDEDRESLRWHDAVHETIERLTGKSRAIHVMDREADSYELLADLVEHAQRFVVRVSHDRRLGEADADGEKRLYEAMAGTDILLEREIHISRRAKPKGSRAQRVAPARAGRPAFLRVRAGSYAVARNRDLPFHLPDELRLNFVEVVEENPPEGQVPVVWRLVTSEPIATADDVAAVIDLYRMRWTIEEYFKAIKTGCNFEKLQLETGRALVMALAIYSAVAWRLLLVRWMQRERPDADASLVVTPVQLRLLARHMEKIRRPWPEQPTSRDALLAIAAIGGHIPNNGMPGWQVLGRGFHDLLLMEVGWANAMADSEQSSDR